LGLLNLFSGTQAEKVGKQKNCEKCKRAEKKPKYCVAIDHEFDPNPSKDRAMPEGDNPLFGM
jgi:hypothetical protein